MVRFANCFLLVVFVLVSSASAQRWLDNNGDPPINPNSGLSPDPTFCYDPLDGLFYIYNAGPNGTVDSPDNNMIGGDDYGMISMLITYNSSQPVEPVLPLIEGAIAWASPVVFNGKIQLSGNTIGAAFLPIHVDPVPIVQLAPGLTADDFRGPDGLVSIETGGNTSLETPGSTLFSVGDAFETGAFKIVPEPATRSLIVAAGLALLGWRQR